MKNKKAFTLIELIVVVAIVGVLVAMLAPMASGQLDNATKTAARANARTFYSAAQSAVVTISSGWEAKGEVSALIISDISDIYYETGAHRVYFGKDIANKGGRIESISAPIDVDYISADESRTGILPENLYKIQEVNKHMELYLGNDRKIALDKGGYRGITPPRDNANPDDVALKITTTGKNATGTFAGREYQLEVSGLTPEAKYQVTIDSKSVGEFTYSDGMYPIELKGKFVPKSTNKAQVNVVAVNPGPNFPAEKKPIEHDLTFYDGDGSTAKPYLICDYQSLQMLSLKVEKDNANFGGKNYKQIATIDMSPVAKFTPIGLGFGVGATGTLFRGTYDGGAKLDGTGYEIRNLKVQAPKGSGTGLFGYTEGATLKNIGMAGNMSLSNDGSNGGGTSGYGSIVGYAYDNSTLTNVYNKATITISNSRSIGGIIGHISSSTLTNAYNMGSFKFTSGSYHVGGIAGYASNSSIITNVYNTGSVEISGKYNGIGGIFGVLSGSSLVNAYNTGTINTPKSSAVGGIAGLFAEGAIINAYNTADVAGTTQVGGAVGELHTYGNPATGTNAKYKRGITITGTSHLAARPLKIKYGDISEFVNATGAERGRWNNKGQLLNADGTVMGGPNPGDPNPGIPWPTITVKNTATTNPTGTFAGRAYALDMSVLTPGKTYTVKLFEPKSVTAYETINFTPTKDTHTLDLTGKFKPTIDSKDGDGVHTIALYDGAIELEETTRDISFYYGNGTYKMSPDDVQDGTEDFYAISDPESLKALSLKVDKDNANFGGKKYKQVARVDMQKGYKTPTSFEHIANFTPIGSEKNPFRGTYDGGAKLDTTGYDIISLTINLPTKNYVGLFGYIEDATLKNIGVAGGPSSSIKGESHVGGIVGYTKGNSSITNVYNQTPVFGTLSMGGIAGTLGVGGSITNAYNKVVLTLPAEGISNGANSYIGGIVGDAFGSITNVYNTHALSIKESASGVGGVVGQLTNGGSLTNAYNTGTINDRNIRYVGGVVGLMADATVSKVHNTGNMTIGREYGGGVVGSFTGGGSISDAYNTGSITSNSTSSGRIGGIIGSMSSTGIVSNVYNKGNISFDRIQYVGGIVGSVDAGTISNAYNTGSVVRVYTTSTSGNNFIGGIAGAAWSKVTLSNIYSTGGVAGRADVGGVVGMIDYTMSPIATNVCGSTNVTGTANSYAKKYNVAFTTMSEFLANTGADRGRWNDKGQLLNADGTLMGGQ